jgi:hypothetical protein
VYICVITWIIYRHTSSNNDTPICRKYSSECLTSTHSKTLILQWRTVPCSPVHICVHHLAKNSYHCEKVFALPCRKVLAMAKHFLSICTVIPSCVIHSNLSRTYARSIRRPFELFYDPYTQSIEVLDTAGRIYKALEGVTQQLITLTNAVQKFSCR